MLGNDVKSEACRGLQAVATHYLILTRCHEVANVLASCDSERGMFATFESHKVMRKKRVFVPTMSHFGGFV